MCSSTIEMECHTAIPFDEELLQNVCISLPNLQTIVDHIINSRTVSDFNELVWALKALTLTDLTTLAGDDTKANVTRLCQRAAYPIADMDDLIEADLHEKVHTAAVCVYPARVSDALEALRAIKKDSTIQIAAVATGFPTGQYSLKTRLQEIEYAIESGATEIDVVINRALALEEKWEELYGEIKKMRLACSDKAHLKTILAIGELGTMDNKLLSEVKRNWPSSGKGRPSVNAQTALYVTQWGLSNENSLRKISQRFSLSIGLIHNTIMKTCKILAGLTTKYILWPKEEELNTLTNRFRQLFQPTGFPSVIGCVGVTPILISSAIDSYYNSEGFSSIILQGICDSNLIFRNVYFGCPGGSKTAAVWYSSPVGISLACGELLLPKNSYLLGDATYPLKQYLITPYQNDGLLLKRQQCFNSIHKTTLACIEKAFKNLKSKLKYLNHLHLKKLTNAKFIVLSCVVVHNFIILNSSDLNAAIFEESNINVLKPEETISIVPDNDDIQLGKLRRDELCDWIHQ